MNKKVIRVLFIIFFANLLVVFIKIIIGIILNSNSILADGLHSISDCSANIIAIIGLKLSTRPPDKNYRYGYYKYETIASMFIGFILFFITVVIITNAITWFINPRVVKTSDTGLLLLLFGLIVNLFVYSIENKKSKKYNSQLLRIDALHTLSDCLISIGVILSAILIRVGVNQIVDPIVSLIIAVLILKSSIDILKETLSILIDINVVNEEELKNLVYQTSNKIINIHNIRSRGNEYYKYIDMHIIVNPFMSVKEAHELDHTINDEISKYYCCHTDTICHIEPDERNTY